MRITVMISGLVFRAYWTLKEWYLISKRRKLELSTGLHPSPGPHCCWQCKQYDLESQQCCVAMMTPRGTRYLYFPLDEKCYWDRRVSVTEVSIDKGKEELLSKIESAKKEKEAIMSNKEYDTDDY